VGGAEEEGKQEGKQFWDLGSFKLGIIQHLLSIINQGYADRTRAQSKVE
jgi:hypothetical protein